MPTASIFKRLKCLECESGHTSPWTSLFYYKLENNTLCWDHVCSPVLKLEFLKLTRCKRLWLQVVGHFRFSATFVLLRAINLLSYLYHILFTELHKVARFSLMNCKSPFGVLWVYPFRFCRRCLDCLRADLHLHLAHVLVAMRMHIFALSKLTL
jgi:hypothetical protein